MTKGLGKQPHSSEIFNTGEKSQTNLPGKLGDKGIFCEQKKTPELEIEAHAHMFSGQSTKLRTQKHHLEIWENFICAKN